MKKLFVILIIGVLLSETCFADSPLVLVSAGHEEDRYYNIQNKLEYCCIKSENPYKELFEWTSYSIVIGQQYYYERAYDTDNKDYKSNYSSKFEESIMQPAVDLILETSGKYSLIYIIDNISSHFYFIYKTPDCLKKERIQLAEIY